MSERTVSVAEAKAHLSELLASREEVTITKRGVAIARLVPHAKPRRKIDLEWLQEMTAGMPMGEDTQSLIRQMRDGARY